MVTQNSLDLSTNRASMVKLKACLATHIITHRLPFVKSPFLHPSGSISGGWTSHLDVHKEERWFRHDMPIWQVLATSLRTRPKHLAEIRDKTSTKRHMTTEWTPHILFRTKIANMPNMNTGNLHWNRSTGNTDTCTQSSTSGVSQQHLRKERQHREPAFQKM